MERSFTSFRASPTEPIALCLPSNRGTLQQPNGDRPDLTRNDVDRLPSFAQPDSDGARARPDWLSSHLPPRPPASWRMPISCHRASSSALLLGCVDEAALSLLRLRS